MSSRAITCRELVEIVTAYLEDALTPEDTRRFEQHLTDCEGCRAYLDQMRKTISMVGRLYEDNIAPSARDSLLAAFRDWRA